MVIQQPVGSPLADIIASADGQKRVSRTMLYAIIAAGLLHAGLGYYLYKQHNSIPSTSEEAPPTTVAFYHPPPPPQPKPKPKPLVKQPPPPQNPNFHKPVENTIKPTDTAPFHPSDTQTKTGPVTAVTTDPPQPPQPPTKTVEPAKVAGPPIIVDPHWLSKPTADQMQRVYPPRASTTETTGHVVMQCSVMASGKVTGCAVTSEDPAAFGFGGAALTLAKYFKMSPQTKDGQVIDGAKVNLRLAFTLQ